ncbi:MAG: hypothetical protein ACO1SX_07715 [Actinomycetota bacterium]
MTQYRRTTLLLAALLTSGFAIRGPVAADERPAVRTRVIAHPPEGLPVERLQALSRAELVGEYNTGMIGSSYFLTLRNDGSYWLADYSCLGLNGSQNGRWMLDREGIRLSIRRTDGSYADMPRDRLTRRLRVVSFGKHFLFIEKASLERLNRYGLEPHRYYHRREVRDAASRDHLRRLFAPSDQRSPEQP